MLRFFLIALAYLETLTKLVYSIYKMLITFYSYINGRQFMHWHDLNPPMYWDMLQTPKDMQRKQNLSPRVSSPTTGVVIKIRTRVCTVLVF